MLTLERAKTPAQYGELLELISQQHGTCMRPLFDWLALVYDDFGAYFRQTGSAYRVCRDGFLVGMAWVEWSDKLLFIHGLIVKPECQGQGIGNWALEALEKRFRRHVRGIGLWVHSSNPRARALYERQGFRTAGYLAESGFYQMVKPIRPITHPGRAGKAALRARTPPPSPGG
jgi:ribosomal protein S18 acetylase RimI-like enzyme